jgi:hypothetical protein
MNATTSTGRVQQFIQRTERLYSLPAVAVDVLRLTSEPRVERGPAGVHQASA